VERGWKSEDVIRALVTYIMMGNNTSQAKRIDRAANPDKAREMAQWLASKEVKKGAKSGNPITLGRIAKAYAPALKVLRLKLASKIRLQLATRTPVEQADIAFLGYENTKQCADSRDYVEKFGLIISRVAFPGMSEVELRARNEGFARIAQDGLDRDKAMLDLLRMDELPDLDKIMSALHKPVVPAAPVGAATGAKAKG
jgi:hypothetical protein